MSAKLTMADLDRFLGIQPLEPRLENYLRAAAVLSAFDPATLNPLDGVATPAERDELLSKLPSFCESVAHQAGLWAVSLPHRRKTLKALGTRAEMKRALKANSERPQTVVQIMFERLINGEQLNLDRLSRAELAAVLEVLEWVEDVLDALPDKTAVHTALARSDLVAPMERLAGDVFVGRKQELTQLREFVFGPKPPAPLFVFGTGGVGKSTLLARFMLVYALPANVACVYIDVDRATIRADQPLTVLLDFILQLHPQLGVSPDRADSLVKEITFALSRQESGRQVESASAGGVDDNLIYLCAREVGEWLKGRTAVLVVDTLEEAQFLGSDVIEPLIQTLLVLDGYLNELRMILLGRALPQEYVSQAFPGLDAEPGQTIEEESFRLRMPEPARSLNLTDLSPQSARELLRIALTPATEAALSDEDLNDVIGVVGRNPMVLKLTARLLEEEGVEKLRSERSEVFAKLKAEKIQALLYGRILRHIHDDEVRKVAYPGLIVRRITQDVIREVLAEPCKLNLTPEHNEYDIFYKLSAEEALIYTDPIDGSLRHRGDVRRSMLEDLTDHIDPAVIHEIDTRAVEFYSKRDGAVARAEEIYHRLRLEEDKGVLTTRWVTAAAPYLQSALYEVKAEQQLWLAERLDVTLDNSVRETASQEAWEKQAARSADRYLKARLPESALKVLHERETRLPRSNLYALETEAYWFMKNYDEALSVARKGVESMSKAGAIDMAIELLLKMVVIEEGRGDLRSAEKFVKEADAVSVHSADDVLRLRVLITGLRLQRQLHPAKRKERTALKRQASAALTDDMLRRLRNHPVLLREVAAELSKQDARVAAAALETLGFEVSTDAQAEAFAKAVAHVSHITDPRGERGVAEPTRWDPAEIRKWAKGELTSRDAIKLSRSIAASKSGDTILRDFRNYFREGVSSALKGQDRE